jgi:hypothetical protein
MRLAANSTYWVILCAALSLTSCQKELDNSDPGTGNTNTIIGQYDFVGTRAVTYSSVIVSLQGSELKAITTSDYVTVNNVGTATITSSDIVFTGVGYSIDTTANTKTYIDGTLADESDLPFVLAVSPANSTNPYTRINNDSLSVIGALGVPNPAGAAPAGPVGARISWSGDTLLLKIASSFTQNVSQGGVPGTLTGIVNGVAKLKKR